MGNIFSSDQKRDQKEIINERVDEDLVVPPNIESGAIVCSSKRIRVESIDNFEYMSVCESVCLSQYMQRARKILDGAKSRGIFG